MSLGRPDFTRRGFVALTCTGLFWDLRLAFGASDFWNKKDPATWSGGDIRTLTTESPWAKAVAVASRAQAGETFPGSSPAGSGLPGDPAIGSPGQQANNPRMNIPIGGADANTRGVEGRRPSVVTVRWESAEPIRDALKNSIPSVFDQHYVISVSGFQIPGAERAAMLEQLKASASLQARGKDRVQPGVAQYSKDGSIILFAFLKELFPLTAADKDVQFTINTGDLSLRAKFDPKEMTYHGQLAI